MTPDPEGCSCDPDAPSSSDSVNTQDKLFDNEFNNTGFIVKICLCNVVKTTAMEFIRCAVHCFAWFKLTPYWKRMWNQTYNLLERVMQYM